jgi:pimeloyl-ACP methyl ester carboxylesterase
VALRYAGTYPDHVERLVVIEGWGGVVPAHERPRPPDRMRGWIETQRSLAARQPRRYGTLDDAYRRMLEANPHLSAEQAHHLTTHGANQNEDGTYSWKFDNYTHASQVLDVPPDDVRALWRNIACPVLLVAGSESWTRWGGDQESLVDGFADARLAVVHGAGHWVQHDKLDHFLELVEEFFA